jgi:hypothetical protein
LNLKEIKTISNTAKIVIDTLFSLIDSKTKVTILEHVTCDVIEVNGGHGK